MQDAETDETHERDVSICGACAGRKRVLRAIRRFAWAPVTSYDWFRSAASVRADPCAVRYGRSGGEVSGWAQTGGRPTIGPASVHCLEVGLEFTTKIRVSGEPAKFETDWPNGFLEEA